MTRALAADDFATIRARLRELRREGTEAPDRGAPSDEPWRDLDTRFKKRREGAPPRWVPTIFYTDAVGR
jgi:hypothetical protein